MKRRGFTLIELLIVIAIIAILALIAIPNFLEAQTRSKVSRSLADIRTQATAVEAYYIDWNSYPRDSNPSMDVEVLGADLAMNMANDSWGECANGYMTLTTPVAYITSVLTDPFIVSSFTEGMGAKAYHFASGSWSYVATDVDGTAVDTQDSDVIFDEVGPRACFAICGVGPDGALANNTYLAFPFMSMVNGDVSTDLATAQPMCWTDYDPTNGTISLGDVYRMGGSINEGRFLRNNVVVGSNTEDAGFTAISANIW